VVKLVTYLVVAWFKSQADTYCPNWGFHGFPYCG